MAELSKETDHVLLDGGEFGIETIEANGNPLSPLLSQSESDSRFREQNG